MSELAKELLKEHLDEVASGRRERVKRLLNAVEVRARYETYVRAIEIMFWELIDTKWINSTMGIGYGICGPPVFQSLVEAWAEKGMGEMIDGCVLYRANSGSINIHFESRNYQRGQSRLTSIDR